MGGFFLHTVIIIGFLIVPKMYNVWYVKTHDGRLPRRLQNTIGVGGGNVHVGGVQSGTASIDEYGDLQHRRERCCGCRCRTGDGSPSDLFVFDYGNTSCIDDDERYSKRSIDDDDDDDTYRIRTRCCRFNNRCTNIIENEG